MKKFLHKLTMGNCSQLLILEARGIMGAIEILGQIDYMDGCDRNPPALAE